MKILLVGEYYSENLGDPLLCQTVEKLIAREYPGAQIIPFDMTGVDFAMTALYTVIVPEQTIDVLKAVRAGEMRLSEALFPLLLGFVATVVSLLTVGKSSFLIAAMAAMLCCFFMQYRLTERRRSA